jgi:hypothetical protein
MASLSGCQVVKVVDTRVRRSVLLGFLPDVQALLHPALAAEPRRKSIDHLNETKQRLSEVQRAFCGIRATEAVVLQTDLDQRNLRELGRTEDDVEIRKRPWLGRALALHARLRIREAADQICAYHSPPRRKFKRINLV